MTAGMHPGAARAAYWLGVGMLTAGLGAAVIAGQGTATAAPADGTEDSVGAVSAHRVGRDSAPEGIKSALSQRRSRPAATVGDGEPGPRVKPGARRSGADRRHTVSTRTADETGSGATQSANAVPPADGGDRPVPAKVRRATAVSKPAATARARVDDPAPAPDTVAPTPATVALAAPAAAHAAVASTGADTLVAGHVTWSTIFVDLMTWWGWRSSNLQVSARSPRVPSFVENWWLGVRARHYISAPTNPTEPNGPTGPSPQTPKLLWETNFTDIAEAQRYWGTQSGRWGQSAGENQYYTDGSSNMRVDANGNLVIEVRRETPPDGAGAPDNYTSARVVTYGKASVEPPVRIVARMKLPYTTGTLPAFWMVGEEPGHEFDWPRQGEVDIVEFPGMGTASGRRQWTGNIHGPAAGDNSVDVKLHDVGADLGVDLSADFHEYGVDWYPDHITWTVDGTAMATVTRADYEALGGDWTPFSGAWPHYLILNTAVGNPWTGDPNASAVFPQQMLVDWVRVYAL